MGKNKKKVKTGLGRSLIKDRFSKNGSRRSNDSLLHSSELNDGYDWGRLNLQSVTEESSFQEFLSTAELAGTEFLAEKLNITFVNKNVGVGLPTDEQKKTFQQAKERKKDILKIPRRPKWNDQMSAEKLKELENNQFLEWRRELSKLQDDENLILTPYEKNLDFWRQLWRVVERSDVVVQILDARNPLMFRSEDFELYVKEIDKRKKNMLLVNKSDFLTSSQRQAWWEYFTKCGIQTVFFSAVFAAEEHENEESEDTGTHENGEYEDSEEDVGSEDESGSDSDTESVEYYSAEDGEEGKKVNGELEKLNLDEGEKKNPWDILGREDLIDLFENLLDENDYRMTPGVTTIGMVGYPNVGKSSTINSLLASKKVSVSATPGKTKHFQTLYLTKNILLCDCPGLVFPMLVVTKADMILNGILPIDQMKDHVPSISLLLSLIPRHVMENKYSVMIPKPIPGEDPNRTPTAEEFLNAYAYSRGFMTSNGQPDNPRAARYVLKDFVQGRLLYCVAPPDKDQETFHTFELRSKKVPEPTPHAARAIRTTNVTGDDLDKNFFMKKNPGVHRQGIVKISTEEVTKKSGKAPVTSKPWKDHSEKRNKREKLRRVYRYLDE